MGDVIRIGTRRSPLALVQARMVKQALLNAHASLSDEKIVLCEMMTTGDHMLDQPLAEIGGKGLFTKEIEEAMIAGDVDIAVHSLKDMPAGLPDGLVIGAMLPREDPRDVLILRQATSLATLPKHSSIGTTSLRRQVQLQTLLSDVTFVNIRGNVGTRLRKLADLPLDGIILAKAGLTRLSVQLERCYVLSVDEMVPAIGQGVIAIECRCDDSRILDLLKPLHDEKTARCMVAERTLMAELGGNCKTPIGGYACWKNADHLEFRGMLARLDGSKSVRLMLQGHYLEAASLGKLMANQLKQQCEG